MLWHPDKSVPDVSGSGPGNRMPRSGSGYLVPGSGSGYLVPGSGSGYLVSGSCAGYIETCHDHHNMLSSRMPMPGEKRGSSSSAGRGREA